jgi:hypothetical protein
MRESCESVSSKKNAADRIQCGADWQSAVSRIGNPQTSADCQSAIRQIANLRYEKSALLRFWRCFEVFVHRH